MDKYFLADILRKETKTVTSAIQSALEKKKIYKGKMEVATKEGKTGHESIKDVSKMINVAKKVKIDKWISCLVLLFL